MSEHAKAVLISGGLDSAILVAHLARRSPRSEITPIFIQSGLQWENIELEYMKTYLEKVQHLFSNIKKLVVLSQPVTDLYQQHWSTTGKDVPDASTPDEAVYLPGRNLLLTAKALVWCHLHKVNELALGILGSNPFPDATIDFFETYSRAVQLALGDKKLHIITPFSNMHKPEVMQLGKDLPLEWSFSCIHPQGQLHCGRCNKCAERKQAFIDAGMNDPTKYER
ncbi:MAG: 7-cyano-7-deazaguanine synthase [Planctomycetia bacterium]|nr:7-cyano-7-deazaguanine synthase [Planctomycetia bacterium]